MSSPKTIERRRFETTASLNTQKIQKQVWNELYEQTLKHVNDSKMGNIPHSEALRKEFISYLSDPRPTSVYVPKELLDFAQLQSFAVLYDEWNQCRSIVKQQQATIKRLQGAILRLRSTSGYML